MPDLTAYHTNLALFDSSVALYSHAVPGHSTSLKRKRTASAPDTHTFHDNPPLLERQAQASAKFSDEETQSTPDFSTHNLPSLTSPTFSQSSANSIVQPLTEENLRLFTMEGSSEYPKTATKTTTSLGPKNIHLIRLYFQSNGLFIDREDALERHPEIMAKAEAIVGRDRNLVMDNESWGRLRGKIREYQSFNELTFLVNVWLELIPAARKARPGDQSQHPGMILGDISDVDNPAVWTERAWNDDFLSVTWSADFARERVNTLVVPPNDSVAKILNLLPRLKTPRPDLTFGLKAGAFSKPQLDLALYLGANLQAGLVHPFFALEAKNASGTIAEAEIQCCRAGAAMVYASRQFKANATTEAEGPGADPSLVFTLALIPIHAAIYVHWAEVSDKGEVSYHQNEVDSYNMNKRQDANSLRQAIYNILDWGLFPRKEEIFETCASIIDVQQQLQEEGAPSKKKKKLVPL